MADQSFDFTVTFRDFQFLQAHMSRRIFTKDTRGPLLAILGVILCAVMLALTVVLVAQSYRLSQVTILGLRYPGSLYLIVNLCLIASIVCLVPAIKLRMKMPRMQVSDDGPLLGATSMTIEEDGLRFNREAVSAKYKWAAFQGVELAKDAIILPVDNGIGHIVPASAFPSQAARLEFAPLISKRVEQSRQAKRQDRSPK